MTFVDDERSRRLAALAAEPELIAGRFELDMLLGEGGMGVVFEAWDREAERCVALKLLREADPASSARFEREAQALAALSHPGIVGYVAHGTTPTGEHYLAMERLVGVTLAARLRQGPLGVSETARLGQGVAQALAAAHARGLVHRDLKPSNLFLEEGEPSRGKLLDFGLARERGAAAVTRTGALVGTPGYMAPEQVRGTTATPSADLFALGAVLFECLTGRAPFVAADTEGMLVKALVERAPALRELCPAAPPALETLIGSMLSSEPSRRPASAAEVARELAACLGAPHADTAPASAAGELAQPGALIAGKYRVQRALGSGGMGIVLLARHETLERRVAIKLLRGDAESGVATARLVREAQAASRLDSEHVARVMDVGTLEDGAPFIVMEYLDGQDLAQVLREQQRLPVDVVLDYVLQAAEAIAEAHVLGIVHRDLKPSNLFLTTRRDGSPLIKVLDFGISKLAPLSGGARSELALAEASITAPDAILGSPLYMSPEQLHSAKLVDARTDIWSLGVVLQQLLTGRPPFEAESFLAIGAQIAAGAPAELRVGCPEAPEGLAAVVRRCLEKSPAQRFANLAELALALRPYAPQRAQPSIERILRVAGARAEPRQQHAQAPGGRRRTLLVLAAAIAALGAALFATRRAAVVAEPPSVAAPPGLGAPASPAPLPHALPPPILPPSSVTPEPPAAAPNAAERASAQLHTPPAKGTAAPAKSQAAAAHRQAAAAPPREHTRATPSSRAQRRPAAASARTDKSAPAADDAMNPALLSR